MYVRSCLSIAIKTNSNFKNIFSRSRVLKNFVDRLQFISFFLFSLFLLVCFSLDGGFNCTLLLLLFYSTFAILSHKLRKTFALNNLRLGSSRGAH